jgi:signal transduction histidine kinase
VSYGIIEQHQGKIEVKSEPGQGTVFTLIFPVEDKSDPSDKGGNPHA